MPDPILATPRNVFLQAGAVWVIALAALALTWKAATSAAVIETRLTFLTDARVEDRRWIEAEFTELKLRMTALESK